MMTYTCTCMFGVSNTLTCFIPVSTVPTVDTGIKVIANKEYQGENTKTHEQEFRGVCCWIYDFISP